MAIGGKQKIIFIIDDDLDDQELFLEALLEVDPGVICHTASNGEEAVHILSKNLNPKPDFIFLDLNLPKLNGKQCLAEIRQLDQYAGTPVIIYSTSSQQKDVEECLSLGASRFITKPCNFRELCDQISEIIGVGVTN